jgi:hypothetical protein
MKRKTVALYYVRTQVHAGLSTLCLMRQVSLFLYFVTSLVIVTPFWFLCSQTQQFLVQVLGNSHAWVH